MFWPMVNMAVHVVSEQTWMRMLSMPMPLGTVTQKSVPLREYSF